MTCRELLEKEHPELVRDGYIGGCNGCPGTYGYAPFHYYKEGCMCLNFRDGDMHCRECWDQEAVTTPNNLRIDIGLSRIKDSGERREFETGAVRDIQEGKGRCDLMPLNIVGIMFDTYSLEEPFTCRPYKIFKALDDFKSTGDVNCVIDALTTAITIFPDVSTSMLEVSKHFEDGAKKYGENNWQKGIPVHCYIDSAIRHYLKYLREDTDEPHDRAFIWNLMCCAWTCLNKPELNDYKKED